MSTLEELYEELEKAQKTLRRLLYILCIEVIIALILTALIFLEKM